jgi:hypothetical protein
MTAAKKKTDEDAHQEAKAEEAEAAADVLTAEADVVRDGEAEADVVVETQSHSSYLSNFVPLEGSAISDHPGAQFEYAKSMRDVAKQAAANEGGRSFDAEGQEAEDRMAEKLELLAEEEVFARTFPGSGGHGDLPVKDEDAKS